MKEIKRTYLAFTAEETAVLEKARDICQTGVDYVDDVEINDCFSELLASFEDLENYAIDQFDYNESEVIGTYETNFMPDVAEEVEYD